MKKATIIVAVVLAIAIGAYALYETGWGTIRTASTDPWIAQGFTANAVSVYNEGTNEVYTLVNITSNAFATRMTAGTCITIPGSSTWTFNAENETSISKVWYATSNGTSRIFIGAY